MKQKISVTVEKGMDDLIKQSIGSGRFRNRSHLIEFAVQELLKGGVPS